MYKKLVRYILLGFATGICLFVISFLAKPHVYTVDYEFDCIPPQAEMVEKVVDDTVLAEKVIINRPVLTLHSLAMLKLNDLVMTNYWSHTNSDGCTFKCRANRYLTSSGGQYYWVGENLYRGVCSTQNAYRLWSLSPAHKEVLDHYSDEQVLVGGKYGADKCYYVLIKGQLD